MSILVSLYVKDGIVFAADKNLTLTLTKKGEQSSTVLEGELTKVLLWPNRKAVVGFVGLAELEDLKMDEWLRIFIAETRDFDVLGVVADLLRERLDSAFARLGAHDPSRRLLIHLGGFEVVDGVQTPMLYLVTNVPGMDEKGEYLPAQPAFNCTEEVRRKYESWPSPSKYPEEVYQRFAEMEQRDHFLWFNNGDRLRAFNTFKGALFAALSVVHDAYDPGAARTLFYWQAYAKMAIELHALYYKHTLLPNQRVVGGGVDMRSIPWPS